MTEVLIVGPSPEGSSMDKLRDLANGERRHIGIADARAINDLFEGLQFRLRAMVQFYDEHVGTPCAQIRWQQEREEFKAALRPVGYYEEDGDYWRITAFRAALEKIAENDSDGLHAYTPQAMQEIARPAPPPHPQA